MWPCYQIYMLRTCFYYDILCIGYFLYHCIYHIRLYTSYIIYILFITYHADHIYHVSFAYIIHISYVYIVNLPRIHIYFYIYTHIYYYIHIYMYTHTLHIFPTRLLSDWFRPNNMADTVWNISPQNQVRF